VGCHAEICHLIASICILFYISIIIIIIIVSINIFIISVLVVCLLSYLLSIYCIFTVLLHYDANKDYYYVQSIHSHDHYATRQWCELQL